MTNDRYTSKAVEAHQWYKNGDHPQDESYMVTPDPDSTTQFEPFLSEGKVVRYYRHPDDSGERECGDCGETMHVHGWIDQGVTGRIVCPGDWIISFPIKSVSSTAYFPVKPDLFSATYEPVK